MESSQFLFISDFASECGKNSLNGRIVGGRDAPAQAWPWMVIILPILYAFYCLLNNLFVQRVILLLLKGVLNPNFRPFSFELKKK